VLGAAINVTLLVAPSKGINPNYCPAEAYQKYQSFHANRSSSGFSIFSLLSGRREGCATDFSKSTPT